MSKLIKLAANSCRIKLEESSDLLNQKYKADMHRSWFKRSFILKERFIIRKKSEIQYIVNYKNYYKYKNIILYLLQSLCLVYNKENIYNLLDCYLLPKFETNIVFNFTKVIQYSLYFGSIISKKLKEISNYKDSTKREIN